MSVFAPRRVAPCWPFNCIIILQVEEKDTQREKDWICMDLCSDGMHVLSGICLCFIWIVLSSCSPCLESNDWLRVT